MDATHREPIGTSRAAALSGILLPGVYVWGATVAAPAFDDGGAPAITLAVAALLALVVGVALYRRSPGAGRSLGVLGFTILSVVTWSCLGDELSMDWIDPMRGGFGALGWLLMALGWGGLAAEPDGPPTEEVSAPLGTPPLEARRRLPATTWWLLGVAMLGASGPLAAAWTVTRPEHALLAHAAAVLAAIGMLTVGGTVALTRLTAPVVPTPAARVRGATPALAVLFLGLAGGLLWALLA